MDVELQATCSALGYLEGNKYIKEPDCLETVRDLIRFLRRDTDTCDIRRQLGHAQIVQSDLIPLVKFYHNDKVLFETLIKLLVNLTQPMAACFNNEIPDEKTLRHNCLEVEGYLQDYKEAFVDEDFFSVIAEKILGILKLDWDKRREEDKLQLERLFVLIRNILMIPPDPQREQRTDDDASTHDQVLWTLHTSGVEDLLLFVSSSEEEKGMLCMHVMEIIALMFREQEAESLALAGLQRSVTEKEKDQKELEQARERERAQRQANILKFSARHSRFGGTFVMKNTKSISDSDVIYHKPLCEVKSFTYDDGKVPKKIGRNRAPIKTDHLKRRSTLSMRLSLKEFCIQFLVEAYNPLMRAVKHALTRKTTQDNDETYYLWAMRFFMEFCRIHCKRVDLVSETMSMSAFHYIFTQLTTYYENLRLGKGEECKVWGRRSHLALKAYQELLRTLDFMSRSEESMIRESAKVIQSNVFYMIEYRDIFITLLKTFKESKCSRAYLQDLVESTHIFLKMLEVFTKSSKHLVVQKKKKGKRKKKKSTTVRGGQQAEPAPEELEALWEEISADLTGMLEGQQEVPEGVSPFDAASEMDMEEQRVEAMLRIQDSLREKRPGEAVALLRAAREVWPERDEFGTQSMSVEEEQMALQEICMAALPRAHRSVENGQELEEEGEDNDAEEEEREDVRRCESEFDFKTFISDFAHQDIVKNYGILLSEFTSNTDAVNHCVVKMLHRLAHDLGYVGMLFQASVFRSFNSLLNGPFAKLPRYKELAKFACYVVRNFTAIARDNKKIFVDLLFWKSKNEALAITSDYDFNNKSKAKVAWTEQQEEELVSLYEKYRGAQHPELDTVELIMGELTSSHTRMQVLRALKKLGLITSARDIKVKGPRARLWTEEEIEQLRDAFEQHKDSDNPIQHILQSTGTVKSKRSVIAKLLELGVVDDKKQLLKQRRGGSGRGGGRGRRKRGGDDEDSEEGERLFPEETTRGRRGRGRSSDGDESESDSGDDDDGDDGEDIRLLVRQAATTIADYVHRLVENGYKNQIAWIQRSLRNCAEDRQEGVHVPTPIVPLTEENETAMEDQVFLIFLRSLGITSPVSEQEMFWRIPAQFSATDLLAIADGLELTEDLQATAAADIQNIVARVFPNLASTSSTTSGSSSKHSGKQGKGRKKGGDRKTKKKVSKEKKPRKKPARKNSLAASDDDGAGDDDDDDGGDGGSSSSDESIRRGGDNEEREFVPRIPVGVKDSDTSDSGLDPEIEAKEQERLWEEKEGKKKSKKATAEDRKNALRQMIQKRNQKNKRTDRGNKKSKTTTATTAAANPLPAETGADDVAVDDGDSAEEPLASLSSSKTSGNRRKQKRKQFDLDSDADSLSDGDDVIKHKKTNEGDELAKRAESPASTSRSGKRSFEPDSDSALEMQGMQPTPKGGKKSQRNTKRIRFLASDSDSDDNGDVGKANRSSDKENLSLEDDDGDDTNISQSQHEESFKLHFASSDEEEDNSVDDKHKDGNKENSDKQSESQGEESLRLRLTSASDADDGGDRENSGADAQENTALSVESGEINKQGSSESFPATLYTQLLDSDDEDDHIPLRTALKRKRAAVVEDSEEED